MTYQDYNKKISELSPCPECKGDDVWAHGVTLCYVKCNDCGFYNTSSYTAFTTQKAAADNWNSLKR